MRGKRRAKAIVWRQVASTIIIIIINFLFITLGWCDKIKLLNLLLPRKSGTVKGLRLLPTTTHANARASAMLLYTEDGQPFYCTRQSVRHRVHARASAIAHTQERQPSYCTPKTVSRRAHARASAILPHTTDSQLSLVRGTNPSNLVRHRAWSRLQTAETKCIGSMRRHQTPLHNASSHPGVEHRSKLNVFSHRCHLVEMAFVWELTEETIHVPMGCLQGGFGSWQAARSAVHNRRIQITDTSS